MNPWIDIHAHWCLFGRDPALVEAELAAVEAGGCEKLGVLPLPAMGAPAERAVHLIPKDYLDLTGITAERMVHDDLASWLGFRDRWVKAGHRMELLTFLDIRAWDGQSDLGAWWGGGHAGLKGIIVADEDDKMEMPPIRHAPGLSREAYFATQRKVLAAADDLGVPLIYHVDLTHHLAFMRDCLDAHPRLRINIPHMGFSRRIMAEVLDAYPNVWCDLSSLGPHMGQKPDSYREFLTAYPDRVMLGSDAIASSDMRIINRYREWVRALGLSEEVERAVTYDNAARFMEG